MANDPHRPMDQHPLGIRQQVTHMCPECGIVTKPFCPVCLGAGQVTADRLARWCREQSDRVA